MIPNGYIDIFVSLMIKESPHTRVNSSVITACNIVFKENVSVGSDNYTVR